MFRPRSSENSLAILSPQNFRSPPAAILAIDLEHSRGMFYLKLLLSFNHIGVRSFILPGAPFVNKSANLGHGTDEPVREKYPPQSFVFIHRSDKGWRQVCGLQAGDRPENRHRRPRTRGLPL